MWRSQLTLSSCSAVRPGERFERGADDDDRRDRIEKTTDDQEYERDEKSNLGNPHPPGADIGQQRARDLVVGEHPTESRGGVDAEQRHRGQSAGLSLRLALIRAARRDCAPSATRKDRGDRRIRSFEGGGKPHDVGRNFVDVLAQPRILEILRSGALAGELLAQHINLRLTAAQPIAQLLRFDSVGFDLFLQRFDLRPLGQELLAEVVKKAGRTKIGKMAKNKLEISAEA